MSVAHDLSDLRPPARVLADGRLDLNVIDIEEIAAALDDQTDYEHRWLIDPRTGAVFYWTSDTGIDGENRSTWTSWT